MKARKDRAVQVRMPSTMYRRLKRASGRSATGQTVSDIIRHAIAHELSTREAKEAARG